MKLTDKILKITEDDKLKAIQAGIKKCEKSLDQVKDDAKDLIDLCADLEDEIRDKYGSKSPQMEAVRNLKDRNLKGNYLSSLKGKPLEYLGWVQDSYEDLVKALK